MRKHLFDKIILMIACILLPAKVFGASFENEKLKLNLETKEAGENIETLVLFELKNGWHISWENPGDAGVPTAFFENDKKIKPLKISVPETFLYDEIITQYGFGDKAYYLLNLKKNTALKIRWTACKDYCEPEEAIFEIGASTSSGFEKEYENALKTFPLKAQKKLKAEIKAGTLEIDLKGFDENVLSFIAGQKDVLSADAYQKTQNATLKIETDSTHLPLWGLLLTDKGAYEVELEKKPENILILLLLAFFGGVVLNLMPCVFPVLSLKALAMAQKAGVDKGRFWRAFSYTSGVLCSFLAVAGLLFCLKKAGFALGWGFQLQSPYFVGAMILLFVVILLFVLDVWHINLPFLTRLSDISGMHSFLTGFFAVLIASPCTGPFMGAAIGYAMFECAGIYFPMFLSLGLGYAAPFAMLEMFPKSLKKMMPKPGVWMVRLKYVLSLPIVLTILWLGWVFYHQIGLKQNDDLWEEYSKEAFEEALDDGDAVFIDFTAKWCLTCLLNEKTTLNSQKFLKAAKQNDIRLFKADWTNNDEDVFEALKSYGRSSVPLYVYYPEESRNFQILPQILTIDSTIDVIENQ